LAVLHTPFAVEVVEALMVERVELPPLEEALVLEILEHLHLVQQIQEAEEEDYQEAEQHRVAQVALD
jgi:hypothetical protein